MTFCATQPAAANSVFNVTNDDFFRWVNVWPRISAVFDIDWAPPQTNSLTEFMADKGPHWEKMRARCALKPYTYADLAARSFGDYVSRTDWDAMSDTTRIRRAGFHDVVDTEEMIMSMHRDFREHRLVP